MRNLFNISYRFCCNWLLNILYCTWSFPDLKLMNCFVFVVFVSFTFSVLSPYNIYKSLNARDANWWCRVEIISILCPSTTSSLSLGLTTTNTRTWEIVPTSHLEYWYMKSIEGSWLICVFRLSLKNSTSIDKEVKGRPIKTFALCWEFFTRQY